MATIRTITDPQELILAQLHDLRAGNAGMRDTIKRSRALLKGGLEEEARLEAELAQLAATKGEEPPQ